MRLKRCDALSLLKQSMKQFIVQKKRPFLMSLGLLFSRQFCKIIQSHDVEELFLKQTSKFAMVILSESI